MRSVFCPREALLYVVLVVLVVFPPHQVASKQHKQPYHSIFRMNQRNPLRPLAQEVVRLASLLVADGLLHLSVIGRGENCILA